MPDGKDVPARTDGPILLPSPEFLCRTEWDMLDEFLWHDNCFAPNRANA